MKNLYAVIMAGGSGERFWPKSRKAFPKQLMPIISKSSMLKETLIRLKGIVPEDKIFIVTNKIQKKLVKKESRCKNVIAEPLSKNTAPCVAVSASIINKKDPEAIMIVMPSDHKVKDIPRFQNKLIEAVKIANKNNVLVTLGIKPSSPHTGYGYIEKGEKLTSGLFKVSRFTEKPDLKTAEKYVGSGRYLWNSGMFIWKASTILEEIKRYMPELFLLCRSSNLNKVYRNVENISIDYGVMEKTKRAVVLEVDFNWDDVGNWSSLDKHIKRDKDGNIIQGNIIVKDVGDSTIMTNSSLVAAIGLSNIIIVAEKDSVLICPKERAEEVKHIVGILKKEKRYKRYL